MAGSFSIPAGPCPKCKHPTVTIGWIGNHNEETIFETHCTNKECLWVIDPEGNNIESLYQETKIVSMNPERL